MFVPRSAMSAKDWADFAEGGSDWDLGDKARAVLLGPGDVLVMGPGTVHAVLTMGDSGPCLMTGGSFWDGNDLLHLLETLCWIGVNQGATNEALAYQLAPVVSALEEVVLGNRGHYLPKESDGQRFGELVKTLQDLGCACKDCKADCSCLRDGRRCTAFCVSHAANMTNLPPCMEEA